VDLRALPEPSAETAFGTAPSAPAAPKPRDVTATITQVWCQLLRVDRIGPDEDFFDLGADSLTPQARRVYSLTQPPPLSAYEVAILLHHRADPGSDRYNGGRMFVLASRVAPSDIERAVQAVVSAHIPLTWSYGAVRVPAWRCWCITSVPITRR